MPITDGVWYRIAIVVDGTNCTWYHGTDSGALTSASVADIQSPTNFTQQWSIGYDSFDADTIDGRLANVKIWTGVARSESEFIDELATTAAVNSTGLVQRHPFDVAETTDYSGNNNTLSGGVGTTTEDGPPLGTTGTLSAAAPLPAASLAGDVTNPGVLAATGLLPTSSVAGTVTATGGLAAAAPLPVASLAGDVVATGGLAGSAPPPAAAVAGTVTAQGTLTATAPLPTAVFTTADVNIGALVAAAPLPVAALTGAVTASGFLAAAAPLPVAALVEGQIAWPPTAGAITVLRVATGVVTVR